MKRIVSFELKKLFRNRFFLVALIILSGLNVYHIYNGDYANYVVTQESYYTAYFEVYDDVSGAWNTETIDKVIAEYEKAKAIVDAGKFPTEPN